MNIALVELQPDRNDMTLGCLPHPGLAYIAACLERNGHKVRIVDSISSSNNTKRMLRQVAEFSPRIVGFTSTTAARFRTIGVMNAVKDAVGAFIVAGGPHFHPTARDAMSRIPAIDCIVKGEGEMAMVEIAKAIDAKSPLSEIPGIFFRQDGGIFETPDRAANSEINLLPMPAYHLFDLKRYKVRMNGKKGVRALGVISSRGCPCRCIFCSSTALKKHNFTKRLPGLFVDEVAYFHKTYGQELFMFNDDTITMDRSHIADICRGLMKKRLNIRWSALARVNTVDRDLLSLMKEAGCCYILYGIESGSDATLTRLKKGITVAQAADTLKVTAKVGIPFEALFMVSFPGETAQDLQKTIDMINQCCAYPNSRAPYAFTAIYPGTDIEQMAYAEKVLSADFSWNEKYAKPVYSALGTDPFTPCWETPALPLEDIKAMILRSRPLSYKIRSAFNKMRNFTLEDIFFSIRITIRSFAIR